MRPREIEPALWPRRITYKKFLWVLLCLAEIVPLVAHEHPELLEEKRFALGDVIFLLVSLLFVLFHCLLVHVVQDLLVTDLPVKVYVILFQVLTGFPDFTHQQGWVYENFIFGLNHCLE